MTGSDAPASRTLAPWLVAVLATYAYFVGAPGWNQNSRLSLTRAIVETRSIAIDPYHTTTGDKSFRDGHYYCDKAPGASWLAVPAYAGLFAVRRVTGGELPDVRVRPLDPRDRAANREPALDERRPGDRLRYNAAYRLALYLATLLSAGVLAWWAAMTMATLVARDYGVGARRARAVAVVWAIATPALAYATSLYGHATCGAALVLAYDRLARDAPTRRDAYWFGAFAGLAVVTEYPAAVVAAALWGLGAYRHGLGFAMRSAAPAAAWAVALAAYHTAAFGHPLATGYDFLVTSEFAEGMAVRYGIGVPDPAVALQLLFGTYRGLFYVSPVLLLAVWGLGRDAWHGDPAPRRHARIALAIGAYYLLLNAGYYMWDGGAAVGPRHMVPAFGFVALGLVAAWRVAPRATATLAVVSAMQAWIVASVGPEAPRAGDPIWEYAWGRLWLPDDGQAATNLGRWLGLPGPLSLAPLVAIWWWALGQKRPDSPSPAVRPS